MTALQQRAEAAAKRFAAARTPVVVEFAGVPKAGKSTTLGQVHAFLKRCGFRVEVVVEHASICPIRDKKHAHFNVWILGLIEEQLEEEILSLPEATVAPLFDDTTWLDRTAAEKVVGLFTGQGTFTSRESVESDFGRVQALPVVVVRNGSGDLLRLKRREQHEESPLHGKIVIWAGGHVRREDGANGPSIVRGAVRELQEELRISVEPADLKLLGAVWIRGRDNDRTRRHMAIVHEWQARTDDVAIALSATEFFERRGTSLSGSFVTPHQLAADVDSGLICEPWSVEIVRRLLPERELVEPRLV